MEIILITRGAPSHEYFKLKKEGADVSVAGLDDGFKVILRFPESSSNKKNSKVTPINMFYNPCFKFLGFSAVKESGEFLSANGAWERSGTKKIFQEGDDIAKLLAEGAQFEAVWEPYEEVTLDRARPVIIYRPNGADKESYEAYFKEKAVQGGVFCHESAGFILSAYQYADKSPVVKNCYIHKNAEFLGFHARKKVDSIWYFLAADGTWQKALEGPFEQKIIHEGESLEGMFTGGTLQIELVAVWKSKDSGALISLGHEFFKNPLMLHGLGEWGGVAHANKIEGLEEGAKAGYKYFETDLHLTSCGRVVLFHVRKKTNQNYALSYDEIRNKEFPYGKVNDTKELYDALKRHEDIFLELDLYNESGSRLENLIKALLKDFKYDKNVLDRLLVQVISAEQKHVIESVYPFKIFQIMAGKRRETISKNLDICLDEGICAMAVRTYLTDKNALALMKSYGLNVLAYTLKEDVFLGRSMLDLGVNTLCVNSIKEEDIREIIYKRDYKIIYNSGIIEGVREKYPKVINRLLRANLVKNPSGSIEYKDKRPWSKVKGQRLKGNIFKVPGKRFVGWNMRVAFDGDVLWQCNDGFLHPKSDIDAYKGLEKMLFKNKALMPPLMAWKEMNYVLVAVWKS